MEVRTCQHGRRQSALFVEFSRIYTNLYLTVLGLPKFVELTNCGSASVDLSDYAVQNFNNGVTVASSTQALTGSLNAGESFVVSYENNDDIPASSTFHTVYGFDADELTPGAVINGDDAIALVLLGDEDGTIVDVYGEIGTDGSMEVWDYEDSYSYRKPGIQGPSSVFNVAEWTFAGAGNLAGATVEQIANQTSPGTHVCQQGGTIGGGPSSSSRAPSASAPSVNVMPVSMPAAMPILTTATAATSIPEIQGRYGKSSVRPLVLSNSCILLFLVVWQWHQIFVGGSKSHGRDRHRHGRREQ